MSCSSIGGSSRSQTPGTICAAREGCLVNINDTILWPGKGIWTSQSDRLHPCQSHVTIYDRNLETPITMYVYVCCAIYLTACASGLTNQNASLLYHRKYTTPPPKPRKRVDIHPRRGWGLGTSLGALGSLSSCQLLETQREPWTLILAFDYLIFAHVIRAHSKSWMVLY